MIKTRNNYLIYLLERRITFIKTHNTAFEIHETVFMPKGTDKLKKKKTITCHSKEFLGAVFENYLKKLTIVVKSSPVTSSKFKLN